MAKRASQRAKKQDGLALFRALGDYATAVSRGRMQKGRLFSLCVRASLSKCYEFNLYAWDERNSQGVFFSLPIPLMNETRIKLHRNVVWE